jgi:riboflavin synthase
VDGVSLTVNDLPAPGIVQLSIIEYTLRHTALGDLAEGRAVHVEADVVGKYVKRLMEPYVKSSSRLSALGARPGQ